LKPAESRLQIVRVVNALRKDSIVQ